jgi:predicted membrane-bound spermidine synthase
MLYFTNSLGAAFGVLASGFWLIEKLGLPGTILTAGILNVALALVVWAITKSLPPQASMAGTEGKAASSGDIATLAILVLAFATGAASFVYEITWIRMLTMGLGASTHAFEVMLSAFILGMALGGLAIRNRIAAMSRGVWWLAGLVAAKGAFAILALGVYVNVLDLMQWTMSGVAHSRAGYTLITLFGQFASMLVMFPSAFMAGMTLPVATNVLLARGVGEASIGKVYSANTAGCIFGAFFATHLGMEMLGLKGLTGFGAALDIGVATLVVAAFNPHARARAALAAVILTAGGTVVYSSVTFDQLKMASGVFRHGNFLNPAVTKIAFYRDGKTATVSVTAAGTKRSIQTNGKPDASVELENRRDPAPDEPTMVLAGTLPLVFKPDLADVAIIGFGSGLTTHTILGSPHVKRVDTIEIEPAMVEGARLFEKRNGRAYSDPRSHIRIDDAKTYFAATGARYDVIISEPSNPWVSGVSTLFSEEFYRQIRRYLKDDGILVQWVHLYEINIDLVSSIFKALGGSFSDYRVFNASPGDVIVVATRSGKLPEMKTDLFGFPNLAADLAPLGYRGLPDIRLNVVGSRRALEPLFLSSVYPANSDFFPVLDLNAARSRFMRESSVTLQSLRRSFTPIIEIFESDARVRASSLDAPGDVTTHWASDARQARDTLAIWLRDDAPDGRVHPSIALQHRLGRLALSDCRYMTPAWVDLVESVIRAAAPYLSTADMKGFVDRLSESKCVARLGEPERIRLAFYAATALRDYPEVVRVTEDALARKEPWPPVDLAGFVVGGVTALLATGYPDRARAFWDRHASRVRVDERRLPITRLVVAHLPGARPETAPVPPEVPAGPQTPR